MIVAVGTDIVKVARIELAMTKRGFVERILTAHEIELIRRSLEHDKVDRFEKVAARFAAKEAIYKVLPFEPGTWHNIEIIENERGAPQAVVHCPEWNSETDRMHVSLSHEREFAVAFAVYERV